MTRSPGDEFKHAALEQFALPFAREERIFLELILKHEIALSNVEESGYSRGFRTGSSKNAVRHEAEPANQFERCSMKQVRLRVPLLACPAVPMDV